MLAFGDKTERNILNRNNMKEMKFYSEDEVVDKYIGEKGSESRKEFDDDIQRFLIGEAIKKARISKNLTQDQLGEMVGVQKAQISKIESGKNITFATIAKVFQAMGLKVEIQIENVGSVSLC